MYAVVIVTFINLFALVFTVLLFVRIILSWIFPGPTANRFSYLMYELTEPVLAPIRRVLPSTGMIDLAPLAAFFLMQALVWLAHYLLLRGA